MNAPFQLNQKNATSGAVTCLKLYCDQPGRHAVEGENGVPEVASFQTAEVSARIDEIKKVWSQGAGNSIELARAVWEARRGLPYGEWEHLLKFLPFSRRKATMLATVGKGLGWLDRQSFAHLPSGWSILYQLAQLSRTVFEQMVREGIIHPRLTLREARELLASFKGRRRPRNSQRAGVKRWLQQLRKHVRRTLCDWTPEERELAKRELTRLLELIDAGRSPASEEHRRDTQLDSVPCRKISVTRRVGARQSPKQPEPTV